MKQFITILLCMSVLMAVFKPTLFITEDYLDYVDANFPQYRPTFSIKTNESMGMLANQQIMPVALMAMLEEHLGKGFDTMADAIAYIKNMGMVETWTVIDNSPPSITKRILFADFPYSDAPPWSLYFSVDEDFLFVEDNPQYIQLYTDYPIPTELIESQQWYDRLIDIVYNIYYFLKGVVTVPVWLIHATVVIFGGVLQWLY